MITVFLFLVACTLVPSTCSSNAPPFPEDKYLVKFCTKDLSGKRIHSLWLLFFLRALSGSSLEVLEVALFSIAEALLIP